MADRLSNQVSTSESEQFWTLNCREGGLTQTLRGEPCNWCDATETPSMDIEWRDDCGYNQYFPYEIVWESKYYDGTDDAWREVGIPHSVLNKINSTSEGRYGWHFNLIRDQKVAVISFEKEDDALWFSLTENKEKHR